MSQKFNISRRKALAALGTVGVASAGAGFGTSAYFSDTESFDDNTVTAGELDMKVGWTEHYSDWSDDEKEDVGTVSMQPSDSLTGFPSTAPESEKAVYVENPGEFIENTAIEAFPDPDPTSVDPENVEPGDYDAQKTRIDDEFCDIPADLDGALSSPYRTRGEFGGDPNPQTTKEGDSLINISDVKPGDFGEVTFSFHLCGNPGYVWLTGALRSAAENGRTEPERESSEEKDSDDPDASGDYVELLDELRAAVWYDTGEDSVYGASTDEKDTGEGDNIFGTGETLLPLHGSLRSVLTTLEDGMFALDAEPVSSGNENDTNGDANGVPAVSGNVDSKTSYVAEIFVTGDDDRFDGKGKAENYTCVDYEDNLEQFDSGDLVGSEVLNPETEPIATGNQYTGCTTITVTGFDDSNGSISLSSSGPVHIVSVKGGKEGEQVYVFNEPVVLDDAQFETPTNQNISNVDICCPSDGGNGGGDTGDPHPNRQCFPNLTTAYVGFEWWLPADVSNEVQGDSVSFDLGFYTEQCRHNENPGQAN
jgi:predicted ribosomally synthesized peptide with SipW-like signal peptide